MAKFGIQVRTTKGMTDLAEISGSCRMIGDVEATSIAGGMTLPDVNASQANIYVLNHTDKPLVPTVTWNNGTKALTWAALLSSDPALVSNHFTIMILEA